MRLGFGAMAGAVALTFTACSGGPPNQPGEGFSVVGVWDIAWISWQGNAWEVEGEYIFNPDGTGNAPFQFEVTFSGTASASPPVDFTWVYDGNVLVTTVASVDTQYRLLLENGLLTLFPRRHVDPVSVTLRPRTDS